MTNERDWLEWIQENRRRGVDDTALVGAMVGAGIPEARARIVLCAPPGSGAAEVSPPSATSGEAWTRVRQRVREADPAGRSVPRLVRPSRKEFLERAYGANRPVLLEGVTDGWAALSRWTGEYLAETLGGETVEAMVGRDADPDYEANCVALRQTLPFGELVSRVESGRAGNDVYLTANNHFLESSAAAPLLSDFVMPAEYLSPSEWRGRAFMWYGSSGTVTLTHYDTVNVLFTQVRGRKRFLLAPPELTPCLYNSRSVYSDADLERPDLGRFPRLAGVRPLEVEVGPGDALFIPVGWWHHVRSLSVSLSLTFTNFAFPNRYEW